jgi:hypothetical protein
MNNFRNAFSFYFTQIWFCVLVIYVMIVNPTEAGRDNVIPWLCLGLVGAVGHVGDCLHRLNSLQKRIKELEVNFEEKQSGTPE